MDVFMLQIGFKLYFLHLNTTLIVWIKIETVDAT